jgi:hypothetical protein
MFLYDANGNTVRHNSAADIAPPRRCSFTSNRPLAITEDLKIFTKDGEPHLHSGHGLNPLQIQRKIRKWQYENPRHPRFCDSELWLEAYLPQIQGAPKEGAEKTWAALLLYQLRDDFRSLGCSDEQANKRAVAVVRDLFKGRGYSDEEAERKVAVTTEAAEKLAHG